MWVVTIDETKYKCLMTARETMENYKYPSFATETVEQNISKQVSVKETALQNVYKYSRGYYYYYYYYFFFFLGLG